MSQRGSRRVTVMIHTDDASASRSWRVPVWVFRATVGGAIVVALGLLAGVAFYVPLLRAAGSVPLLRGRIAELEVGDAVGVRTATTWFVYRVTSSEIVAPEDIEVIAPVPGTPGVAPTEPVITLTSCHPLYGSSERYVVHGALVGTAPAADGVPDALLEEVA